MRWSVKWNSSGLNMATMNNAMMVLTTRGETSVAESVAAVASELASAFFESSPLLHRLRMIELMDNFWCQQYIVGTMICSVARRSIVLLMLYIVYSFFSQERTDFDMGCRI